MADLLALPRGWLGGFDLVVESMNVQALPEPPRGDAIRGVTGLVAPGGTLVVIAFGSDGTAAERDAAAGPPWPLVRGEIDAFAGEGVDLVAVERVVSRRRAALASDVPTPLTRRRTAHAPRSCSAGSDVGVGAPNMLP